MPDNLYYDAAVRSMACRCTTSSTGRCPTARTAIDKPPIDLWLQVVAVKLFGFDSTVLKLPEAFAGTLAMPLLYDLVRHVAGRSRGSQRAGAGDRPAQRHHPRSDTMDSVMMALLVATAWLLYGRSSAGACAGSLPLPPCSGSRST